MGNPEEKPKFQVYEGGKSEPKYKNQERIKSLFESVTPVRFGGLKEDNPKLAAFLINQGLSTALNKRELEFVYLDKNECEKYKKLLEEKVANTPHPLSSSRNWEGTLKEIKLALETLSRES